MHARRRMHRRLRRARRVLLRGRLLRSRSVFARLLRRGRGHLMRASPKRLMRALAAIATVLVGTVNAAAQEPPAEPAPTAAPGAAAADASAAHPLPTGAPSPPVAPSPPGAPSPLQIAPDVVRLRDGTRLRGTVAEYRPGAGVTLVLSSGAVRVIAPADVEAVVRLDANTPTREGSGTPRASAPPVYVATGVRARSAPRAPPSCWARCSACRRSGS